MVSVIIAIILLSVTHALLPNHWMPLVAIAKSEKWSRQELFEIASISAFAHVAGTILLGFVLGIIGARLEDRFDDAIHMVTSLALIVFGLFYISFSLPHAHSSVKEDVAEVKKSKYRWLLVFVLMMFVSPCFEVEGLFLTAGTYGKTQLIIVAIIYGFISITAIVAMSLLMFNGIRILKTDFIEKYEKRIAGLVLIGVGIVTFFIK